MHGASCFIEIAKDVWDQPCRSPGRKLPTVPPKSVPSSVSAAMELVKVMLGNSKRPLIWAGAEIQRGARNGKQGGTTLAQRRFQELVDETRIPYCTSLFGKGILSEQHSCYIGIFDGKYSSENVKRFVTRKSQKTTNRNKDTLRRRISFCSWEFGLTTGTLQGRPCMKSLRIAVCLWKQSIMSSHQTLGSSQPVFHFRISWR